MGKFRNFSLAALFAEYFKLFFDIVNGLTKLAERTRRVTYTQLEELYEFLAQKPEIARGFNKSCQARENSKRLWQAVALTLNSHGDGATKDAKGWNKYWIDYKVKLKKHAAAVKASQRRTGGGPPDKKPLAEIEQKFLSILDEGYGCDKPGARVEPLKEMKNPDKDPGPSPQPCHVWLSSPAELSGRSSHTRPSVSPRHDGSSGRSSPAARPPAGEHSALSSPHRPRMLRRLRRGPIMSAEAARRSLIISSDRRLQVDKERNQILREILEAITENNQLIRERWPAPRPNEP